MRTREVRRNSLYDYKGIVCRVQKQLKNGRFLVRHHKIFHAVASGPELQRIDTNRVAGYLREAGIDTHPA